MVINQIFQYGLNKNRSLTLFQKQENKTVFSIIDNGNKNIYLILWIKYLRKNVAKVWLLI